MNKVHDFPQKFIRTLTFHFPKLKNFNLHKAARVELVKNCRFLVNKVSEINIVVEYKLKARQGTSFTKMFEYPVVPKMLKFKPVIPIEKKNKNKDMQKVCMFMSPLNMEYYKWVFSSMGRESNHPSIAHTAFPEEEVAIPSLHWQSWKGGKPISKDLIS